MPLPPTPYPNPLRVDPTRTVTLRLRFMRAVRKRVWKLKNSVKEFILELDALGLGERENPNPFGRLVDNVQPREYEFLTDAGKLNAFRIWFAQQVEAGILSPDAGTPPGQPWTTEYVESAWKRGQINAYLSSRGLLDELIVGMAQEEFLRQSFQTAEAFSKVLLLGTRAWNEMKGFSDAMSQQLNRILAQAIADGRGPRDVAREMLASIDSLTRSRALTIARTEIINAHAEGQLDAFDKLGIKKLGIRAEWSTAGDSHVCEKCAPMEGRTFTVEQARGMIPLHPNCRCSWLPSKV